jgi:hypothetical protein
MSYRQRKASYSIRNRGNFWKVVESDKLKISVDEYAKKYKFSSDYVRRLCRAGILMGIKSRGKWLVLDEPIAS